VGYTIIRPPTAAEMTAAEKAAKASPAAAALLPRDAHAAQARVAVTAKKGMTPG